MDGDLEGDELVARADEGDGRQRASELLGANLRVGASDQTDGAAAATWALSRAPTTSDGMRGSFMALPTGTAGGLLPRERAPGPLSAFGVAIPFERAVRASSAGAVSQVGR